MPFSQGKHNVQFFLFSQSDRRWVLGGGAQHMFVLYFFIGFYINSFSYSNLRWLPLCWCCQSLPQMCWLFVRSSPSCISITLCPFVDRRNMVAWYLLHRKGGEAASKQINLLEAIEMKYDLSIRNQAKFEKKNCLILKQSFIWEYWVKWCFWTCFKGIK